MARRFSGTSCIVVAYDDASEKWVGRVFDPTKKSEERSFRFAIKPAPSFSFAVDSPLAYDEAARAACAFATADGYDFHFDYDGSGIKTFRNRATQDYWYNEKRG